MCILCVFYMCAAIGVIINDDDDDDKTCRKYVMYGTACIVSILQFVLCKAS